MREVAQHRSSQLPVVQPIPATRRAGPLAVGATALAMMFVVGVVLYGITRSPHEEQAAASAPPAAAQTAAAPGAETAGATPSGDAGARPQSAGGAERSTTGQGGTQGGGANPNQPATTPEENRGQQSQTQNQPPASGESASGTTSGPNARPTRPPAPVR